MSTSSRMVRVTVPLKLLCDAWDTRTDPNQDLDGRLEELLIKGLKSRGIAIPSH